MRDLGHFYFSKYLVVKIPVVPNYCTHHAGDDGIDKVSFTRWRNWKTFYAAAWARNTIQTKIELNNVTTAPVSLNDRRKTSICARKILLDAYRRRLYWYQLTLRLRHKKKKTVRNIITRHPAQQSSIAICDVSHYLTVCNTVSALQTMNNAHATKHCLAMCHTMCQLYPEENN